VVTRQDPADPRSMDALVVRVASRRPDAERLTDQLVEAAASATGVRPPVALTGANDIYDPRRHAKAQRFVDRRSASAGAGE